MLQTAESGSPVAYSNPATIHPNVTDPKGRGILAHTPATASRCTLRRLTHDTVDDIRSAVGGTLQSPGG